MKRLDELEKVLKGERENLRRKILEWLRDDVGIIAQTTIYPSDIEKLLDRLEGRKVNYGAELQADL